MAESIKIINEEKTPEWKNRAGKFVKMSDMTEAQLQRAKYKAQERILHFHNKASFFDIKVEQLEEEAESRKIELADYDRDFFKTGEQRKLERKT